MHRKLQKTYSLLLFPAAALFIGLGILRGLDLSDNSYLGVPAFFHPVIFVLSVVTALAGPIFMRTWFAHTVRLQNRVEDKIFMRFQHRLLWMCLITPYLAFTAVLCNFPKFHASVIVLMALYAVYYYFPSQKRIDFDRKIFRVQ